MQTVRRWPGETRDRSDMPAAGAQGEPASPAGPACLEPPVPGLRDEALRRLKAGRRYEFLALALALLKSDPHDVYIHLMVVRSYLELGLVTAARDALYAASALSDAAELRKLEQSLGSLGDAPVPWSNFTPRFEANLRAAAELSDVTPVVEAWEGAAGRYQLFRDRNGQFQVRERDEAGGWNWFPILCDHTGTDADRPLPEDVKQSFPGPYLFEGVGLGGYFERLYLATRDTFLGFSCALFVVEPRPERLAVALHLRDWGELLRDPRVLLFPGADWPGRLKRAFDDNLDLPFPGRVITMGTTPANGPRAIQVASEVAQARQAAIVASHAELNERYAGRDVSFWAARFDEALSGTGDGLRVLAGVSTHTTFLQHSMRDAKKAIEALGHSMVLLTETTPYTMVGPLSYHRAIREFNPDIFLVLDHFRPEFGGLLPAKLPVLTWDQDQLPHVLTRKNLAGMAPHDFMVGCSKMRCVSLGLDPGQCLYARVPTCPEQFGGVALTDDERARYECDLSYVSHASQTAAQFHDEERRTLDHPQLVRLLDCVYEILPEILARHRVADGLVTRRILEAATAQTGVQVHNEELRVRLESWYIWRLADRMFRHEALEWAAAFAGTTGRSLRIYGRGWDRHPTLAAFAAGPAENGRELVCVYRASRINLQLMPGGFIHQRALDGLAAGGFFLSRRTPADVKGVGLRRLVHRMDELGIADDHALRDATDPELRQRLHDYLGPGLDVSPGAGLDLFTYIRINAELAHADESFEDFPRIVFDSREDLISRAEHFLACDSDRTDTARRMREVVVERFSYRAAMDRFLRAMARHLADAASRGEA